MIKYLTKVDDHHILYLNEKSVKVKEIKEWSNGDRVFPKIFKFEGITISDNLTVNCGNEHLARIIVAIELVKEIKLQEIKK